MVWGILRIIIFAIAFVIGATATHLWNSVVLDPSSQDADALSPTVIRSMVVTCDYGSPSVEEIKGTGGAIQVRCSRSNMHVARSKPLPPRPLKSGPSTPIAVFIPAGIYPRNTE